jgi:hypothetical protein
MFSSRALFAKLFNRRFPKQLDDINLFHRVSLIGLCFLVPTFAVMESSQFAALVIKRSGRVAHHHGDGGEMELGKLIGVMLINGICYTTYNQASFMVLSRTTLATHAVLNVFRRVFMICVTVHYFGVTLNMLNCVGIGIAVLGMLLFTHVKATAANVVAAAASTGKDGDSPQGNIRRRALSSDLTRSQASPSDSPC